LKPAAERRPRRRAAPGSIPLVKPLQVDVHIDGLAADKVEIDFAGPSMNMGYNRQALVAGGQGRYRGEAMLPVCVSGAMTWQARLLIDSRGQRIAVRFMVDAPR
jgi:hypothetical protein